jgi:hypothetical protein
MRSILLVGLLFTGGCAVTPKARIADTLTRYGLERTQAECVGGDLQRNLSLGQLQELGRAAGAYRKNDPDPSRLTVNDLIRVSSEIKDPAVPLAVARAAGRCGLVPLGFTSMVNALAT